MSSTNDTSKTVDHKDYTLHGNCGVARPKSGSCLGCAKQGLPTMTPIIDIGKTVDERKEEYIQCRSCGATIPKYGVCPGCGLF